MFHLLAEFKLISRAPRAWIRISRALGDGNLVRQCGQGCEGRVILSCAMEVEWKLSSAHSWGQDRFWRTRGGRERKRWSARLAAQIYHTLSASSTGAPHSHTQPARNAVSVQATRWWEQGRSPSAAPHRCSPFLLRSGLCCSALRAAGAGAGATARRSSPGGWRSAHRARRGLPFPAHRRWRRRSCAAGQHPRSARRRRAAAPAQAKPATAGGN